MAVRRGLVTVASAVCIGALLLGYAICHERSDPADPHPVDQRGQRVHYWGLTAAGDYFQATLDAGTSVADTAAALPAGAADHVLRLASAQVVGVGDVGKGAPGPPPPPPPGGFVCSRFVSPTQLDASIHYLGANVSQSCSGTFTEHWIEYRVERSSVLGWRTYKGLEATSATTSPTESWPVGARCGSGGGTYDYRVTTIGHARAGNGVDVADLDEVYGQPGRFDCGTG